MNKKYWVIFLISFIPFLILFGKGKTQVKTNKKISPTTTAVTKFKGDDFIDVDIDSIYIAGKGTLDDPLRISNFLQRKLTRMTNLSYSRNWISDVATLTSCFVTDIPYDVYNGDIIKFPNGLLNIDEMIKINRGDTIYYVHTINSPYNRLSTIENIVGKDSITIGRSRLYYFDGFNSLSDSIVYLMCAREGRIAKITSFDHDSVHFHFNIPDDTLSLFTLKDTTSLIFTPKTGSIINYENIDFNPYKLIVENEISAIDFSRKYNYSANIPEFVWMTTADWATGDMLLGHNDWELTWKGSSKYPDVSIHFDHSNFRIVLSVANGPSWTMINRYSSGNLAFWNIDSDVIPFKHTYKDGKWVFENKLKQEHNSYPEGRYTMFQSTQSQFLPINMLWHIRDFNQPTSPPRKFYLQYKDKFFDVNTLSFNQEQDSVVWVNNNNAIIEELAPCLIHIPSTIPTTISTNGKILTIGDRYTNNHWDRLKAPIYAPGYEEHPTNNCAYIKGESINDTTFIAVSHSQPEYNSDTHTTNIHIERIYYPSIDSISGVNRYRNICIPLIDTIHNNTNQLFDNYAIGVQQIKNASFNFGTIFRKDTILNDSIHNNKFMGYLKMNVLPILPFYNPYSLFRKSFGIAIDIDFLTKQITSPQRINKSNGVCTLGQEIFDPRIPKYDRIWGIDEKAQHIQEGPIKPKIFIPITFIPEVGEKVKVGDYLMTYNHQIAIVNHIEIAKDSGQIVQGEIKVPYDLGVNFLKGINLSKIPQGNVRMRDFDENNKIISSSGEAIDINTPCLVFDEEGKLGIHRGGGYFSTIRSNTYALCGEIDITPYETKDTVVNSAVQTKFWKSTDRVLCKTTDEPVVEFDSEQGEHFRWAGESQILYSTDTTCHYLVTYLNSYFNDPLQDSDYVVGGELARHWGGRYILVPYADQIGVTHRFTIKNPQAHSYYMTPRKNWTGQVALFFYSGEGLATAKPMQSEIAFNLAESYNHIHFNNNSKYLKKEIYWWRKIIKRLNKIRLWHQKCK